MNNHTYEYDELVIGSGLNALAYSYLNSMPLVFNNIKKPFFFESFPLGLDTAHLFYKNVERDLKGFKEDKQIGASKSELWKRLLFVYSLAGLSPLSNHAASMRIDSKNSIKVMTQDFKSVSMKFNKLRIFDDEDILGLAQPKEETKKYKVVDWIDVKSGMVHPYDFLKSSIDFVREVYFYPSERIDGKSNKKDLVSISYLDEQQLQDHDFSDTMARFKILKMMKRAGIKGARNGRDVLRPEQYKYYALNIKPRKRELRKLRLLNRYENEENLIFDYRTDEQIINDEDCLINDYCFKLSKTLLKDGFKEE
tara:strand:- start:918 stop:1844 length:927 start_codon:yes stop_codon:yes gene_type:complete